MLEERVSAIEVTMENALGTLTSILAGMSAIKQFYTKEAGAHTNDVGSDIPMAGDHDGTCTPQSRCIAKERRMLGMAFHLPPHLRISTNIQPPTKGKGLTLHRWSHLRQCRMTCLAIVGETIEEGP